MPHATPKLSTEIETRLYTMAVLTSVAKKRLNLFSDDKKLGENSSPIQKEHQIWSTVFNILIEILLHSIWFILMVNLGRIYHISGSYGIWVNCSKNKPPKRKRFWGGSSRKTTLVDVTVFLGFPTLGWMLNPWPFDTSPSCQSTWKARHQKRTCEKFKHLKKGKCMYTCHVHDKKSPLDRENGDSVFKWFKFVEFSMRISQNCKHIQTMSQHFIHLLACHTIS